MVYVLGLSNLMMKWRRNFSSSSVTTFSIPLKPDTSEIHESLHSIGCF